MDNSYIDMSRDSAIMARSEICNAMLNNDMYKSRESLIRNKSMNKGEKPVGGRRRNSSVSRRKSTKRSFRHPSFGVRSKVKRNIGMSKKQRNMEHSITNRNNEVREERSKSFIVKRRSFRKPRKWSSYIKNSVEEGDHLPRVKGFWRNQKFVRSRLSSLGKIWTEQLKRRTETSNTLTIPRPTLVRRKLSRASEDTCSSSNYNPDTSSDDEYRGKEIVSNHHNLNDKKLRANNQNSEGRRIYPKIVSQLSSCLPDTDSGVYSSVSGNSVRESKNRYTSVRRQNKGGPGILDRSLINKQFIPNMKQNITGPEYFKNSNQPIPELSRRG